LLAFVSFIFYAFGGYYYFDYTLGLHNYDLPYATVLDYLAVITAVAGLIMAIAVVPTSRVVLKIIGILLNGIMLFLSVMWVLDVLFM